MQLFSKNSNLCDHGTDRYGRADGRTDDMQSHIQHSSFVINLQAHCQRPVWGSASDHDIRGAWHRVASLCKEMNLQGKANGRKMVVFGKVRNLRGTENARKDKLESARKGNCKEWNLEGNGICKEWNLQGIEFARNVICR